MLGAFKEMCLQGHNHPSIIGYGYFNEPVADFSTYFAQMKKIGDSINPKLPKYVTGNGINTANLQSVDFYGNQYSGNPLASLPALCTEYLGFSGATRGDQAAEDRYATDALAQLQNCKNDKKNAGGVLWCFRDYWGFGDGGGTNTLHDSKLGIVDQFYVPKRAYYAYRKTNLGVTTDDNPIIGTGTKVVLEPDVTYLRADGTDISCITVVLRDNNGKCISSVASVTLSLSGSSCTLFGPTTFTLMAGKMGVVVRSTEIVGTTTISVTSNGVTSGSTTITTYPAVDVPPVMVAPQASKAAAVKQNALVPLLSLRGNGTSPLLVDKGKQVMVYDVSGRLVAPALPSNKFRHFSPGVYVIKAKSIVNE